MLFHELYGVYYNTVAAILACAVDGNLTGKQLSELVTRKAFAESSLIIPTSLKNGVWPLLTETLETPLRNKPTMPLTILQKRWLKALMSDPRIKLFNPSEKGLEDVKPLYLPEQIVYFDRYEDGDPYTSPEYCAHFKTILSALNNDMRLFVGFYGGGGIQHQTLCTPVRLEYSAKDDKFRLLAKHRGKRIIINVGRIFQCEMGEPMRDKPLQAQNRKLQPLVMELEDRRNALERVMLHFSHLEKETVRLDDWHYRLTVWYDKDDESEILIRVISFGPMVRVLEPSHLVERIRLRLERQNRQPVGAEEKSFAD